MGRANCVTPLAAEFLRRVLAAGVGERFRYLDVVKVGERMKYACAFDQLIDAELVERVVLAPGSWFYRLTATGRELAENKPTPKPPKRTKAGKGYHTRFGLKR